MDSAPATPMAKPVSAGGLDAGMHGLDNGHSAGLGALGDLNGGLNNGLSSGLGSGLGSAPGAHEGADEAPNGAMNGAGSSLSGSNGSGDVGANGTVVDTPKGPPLARVATSVAGVHVAQYANVDVLEQDVGAHTVMRRVYNGSVNATQLLKLANLDRSKRQKVLDREIGSQFEKIQGGTGKYQGTWVPLESAKELARQYGVYDVLRPLFDFDMAFRPQIRPPTQLELDERRRELAQRNATQAVQTRDSQGHQSSHPAPPAAPAASHAASHAAGHTGSHTGMPKASAVAAAAAAAAVVPAPVKRNSTDGDDGKRDSASSSASHAHGGLAPPLAAAESSTATAVDQEFDDLTTMPPVEMQEGDTVAEQSRELVTELFLSANRGETSQLSEIMSTHGATKIQPDVPIDDAGHTALHWAAALGMVPLVADLMAHGAECRRGNRKGESPLVRAVLVTNSSDNNTFGELLDLLFPCLHLGDTQGRTVLHHIALTAGIPGRSDASRYYLESLLEWAVRWRGASGVQWLVDELLDAQDANGDTALNIAARLGSKLIAQQLVDIGADAELPNRAGLRPTDFGIEAPPSATRKDHAGAALKDEPQPSFAAINRHYFGGLHGSNGEGSAPSAFGPPDSRTHSRSSSRAPLDGAEKRQELGDQTAVAVKELNLRLSRELHNKEQVLQAAHQRLKEAAEGHEALLKRKQSLEELKLKRDRARQRVEALEQATALENSKFNTESAQHFSTLPVPDTSFDADEPFVVHGDDELRRLPPVLLQARIDAYLQNEKQLLQLRDRLRSSSLEGEAKYRYVVARCTSSDETKVDDILDDLLSAVIRGDRENDKGEETMEVDS